MPQGKCSRVRQQSQAKSTAQPAAEGREKYDSQPVGQLPAAEAQARLVELCGTHRVTDYTQLVAKIAGCLTPAAPDEHEAHEAKDPQILAAARAVGEALAANPRVWFDYTVFYLKGFGKNPDHLTINAVDVLESLKFDLTNMAHDLDTRIEGLDDGVSWPARFDLPEVNLLITIGDELHTAQKDFELLRKNRIARGVRHCRGNDHVPHGRPLTRDEYYKDLNRRINYAIKQMNQAIFACEDARWFNDKQVPDAKSEEVNPEAGTEAG